MITKTVFVLYMTFFGSMVPAEVHTTLDECESSINLSVEMMSIQKDSMTCVAYELVE